MTGACSTSNRYSVDVSGRSIRESCHLQARCPLPNPLFPASARKPGATGGVRASGVVAKSPRSLGCLDLELRLERVRHARTTDLGGDPVGAAARHAEEAAVA